LCEHDYESGPFTANWDGAATLRERAGKQADDFGFGVDVTTVYVRDVIHFLKRVNQIAFCCQPTFEKQFSEVDDFALLFRESLGQICL
jgi:hypothetical protein